MADTPKTGNTSGVVTDVLQSLGTLLEEDVIPSLGPSYSKLMDETVNMFSSVMQKVFGTEQLPASTEASTPPPSSQK